MHLFRSEVLFAFGIAVLTGIPGCGDDSGGPEKTKSTSAAKPAAKTDAAAAPQGTGIPELPKGAGAVDADAPTEFTTTDSGLKYRILRKSDGQKPERGDAVEVNYKGWLDNGNQFDSSYEKGKAFRCVVTSEPPKGVIKGWVEAMQLVGIGGMIEIIVPPDLGYGPRGFPPVIPPNADLHFIIEMKDIR